MVQNKQVLQIAGLDEGDSITQKYTLLKEVGKGAFGSVFKALDKTKGTLNEDAFVAIKKLFYDRKYEQREVPTLLEIRNHGLCDNIIRLKERYLKQVEEVNPKKNMLKETKEYLYIVTDYLPFTICDINVSPAIYLSKVQQNQKAVANARFLCLESIRQTMYGVFKGLRDLHSIGITHRDIKLSNILIDNDRYPVSRVKICDLGSSKKLISNPNDEST